MNAFFVYMTAPDMDEATRLARTLVEERLVACVNVIDKMTSFYWWDGNLQQSAEVVLIAKTTENLVEPLIARVKALHSYDCPCVVAIPIQAGNPDYLAWIESVTGTPNA